MSAPRETLSEADWQPTASPHLLARRAACLRSIREFMHSRGVLEVETPVLSRAAATDPHLDSLQTAVRGAPGDAARTFYLHTSPEFAMKRLLASGSGPIYQICRVFRDGEAGRLHEPEFSMLEWYRPGCDHLGLMDEVAALLSCLGTTPPVRASYADCFTAVHGLCPHSAPETRLRNLARDLGLVAGDTDRSALLDYLFDRVMATRASGNLLVYDFPSCQAALARVRPGPPAVASRFELFMGGIEVANGFHELGDADEQRQRFEADNVRRRQRGMAEMPLDEHLLAALAHGLPDCAGVAVGIDRLMLALNNASRISEVATFTLDRA